MAAPAESFPGPQVEFGARDVALLFKALADPLRIELVALTSDASAGGLSFHELAEHFSMPQSSLSHHLRILVRAGVLERRRRGTWSKYQLSREVLGLLRGALQPDALRACQPRKAGIGHEPEARHDRGMQTGPSSHR
jgi:DNA-binding transcriptional ArsR family regulator